MASPAALRVSCRRRRFSFRHRCAYYGPAALHRQGSRSRSTTEAERRFLQLAPRVRANLTPLGRLLWERASDAGAREWLDAATFYPSRKMSSDQARVATCIWLKAPIAELANEADPTGRALMRADRAGHVRRHGGVTRTWADFGIEAGYRLWTEAAIFSDFPPEMDGAARGGVASGSSRRMDVVTIPPTGLKGPAMDPTVRDTATPTLLELWRCSANPACPLKEAETIKRAHYADTPPSWEFFPCAHGMSGDMGPGAHECAGVFARLIATRRNGGQPPARQLLESVRRDVYARLGSAVMRELADQLITAFAGNPRDGLTRDNVYTHSAFRPGGGGGCTAAEMCSCDHANLARFGCVCNAAAPAPRAWARRREG